MGDYYNKIKNNFITLTQIQMSRPRGGRTRETCLLRQRWNQNIVRVGWTIQQVEKKRILDINEQMKEVDFSHGKNLIPILFHMKIES